MWDIWTPTRITQGIQLRRRCSKAAGSGRRSSRPTSTSCMLLPAIAGLVRAPATQAADPAVPRDRGDDHVHGRDDVRHHALPRAGRRDDARARRGRGLRRDRRVEARAVDRRAARATADRAAARPSAWPAGDRHRSQHRWSARPGFGRRLARDHARRRSRAGSRTCSRSGGHTLGVGRRVRATRTRRTCSPTARASSIPAATSSSASSRPSAYRPLYPLYLALWSLVDVRSTLGHRLASCLLGAACVAIVGLAAASFGRTPVEGDRIGLIAAAFAARVALAVAERRRAALGVGRRGRGRARAPRAHALLAAAERVARRARRAVVVAVAALGRAELVLLFPLLAWPMWRWSTARADGTQQDRDARRVRGRRRARARPVGRLQPLALRPSRVPRDGPRRVDGRRRVRRRRSTGRRSGTGTRARRAASCRRSWRSPRASTSSTPAGSRRVQAVRRRRARRTSPTSRCATSGARDQAIDYIQRAQAPAARRRRGPRRTAVGRVPPGADRDVRRHDRGPRPRRGAARR